MRPEVAAWEKRRNIQEVKIHWTFTITVARNKLNKLYPAVPEPLTKETKCQKSLNQRVIRSLKDY